MVLTIWPWYGSCWIIQKSEKCIFEWSKEPKKRFLAIFLSLVCWIDLILHIVIELNVFQLSAMWPGHEGSFKDHKNAFWMIQKPKKVKKVPKSRFQVTIWLWVGLIDLILRTLIDEMDANPVLLIKMQGFVRIYSWLASFCEKRQNWAKNEAFGCFLEFGWLECSAAKVY